MLITLVFPVVNTYIVYADTNFLELISKNTTGDAARNSSWGGLTSDNRRYVAFVCNNA